MHEQSWCTNNAPLILELFVFQLRKHINKSIQSSLIILDAALVVIDGTWVVPNFIPEGISDVQDVALSMTHSLLLRSDSTVLAFGQNTSGQLDIPRDLGKPLFALYSHVIHSYTS